MSEKEKEKTNDRLFKGELAVEGGRWLSLGRGGWGKGRRRGSGFEGALGRGRPFEVMTRTLGFKSRKAGYISHPSLNREIGFGQE